MKFKKIEDTTRNSYITEEKFGGVDWTVTWDDEGYWTVAYITERGDLIGLDDTFTFRGAVKLIKKTVEKWG